MAVSVTGLTAARMAAIEAAAIVDAEVVSGDLILTKHDSSTINAGAVGGGGGGVIAPKDFPVVADLTDIEEPYDGQLVWWIDITDPLKLTGGAMMALVETMNLLSPYPMPAGYVQWVPGPPNLVPAGRTFRSASDTAMETELAYTLPDVGLGQTWSFDYGFTGSEISMQLTYSGVGGFFDGMALGPNSIPCKNDSTDEITCSIVDWLQMNPVSGGGDLGVSFSGSGSADFPWLRAICQSVFAYYPALDV